MTQIKRARGLHRFADRPAAHTRLFCFPFAGGNAMNFKDLAASVAPGVEVYGVDYPGRGSRFDEAPRSSLTRLVGDIVTAVAPMLDRPFAFYGHSNGALVAFELARLLSRSCGRDAEALLLGAKRSPLLAAQAPIHHLPDAQFLETLRRYDATPEDVFTCPELLDVYLPILRADFALGETYALTDRSPASMPVHAIAGYRDTLASPDDMHAWLPLAGSEFFLHRIAGEHFFLFTHAHELGRLIGSVLLPSRCATTTEEVTSCSRYASHGPPRL